MSDVVADLADALTVVLGPLLIWGFATGRLVWQSPPPTDQEIEDEGRC